MRLIEAILLIFMLLLAACGGAEAPTVEEAEAGAALPGDPASGQELFQQTTIDSTPGCTTCHSLEPGVTRIGPSLAGITERAGQRVPDLSAEEYLRQSIVEPDAHLVEGFSNIMYQNYEDMLSEEQIDDLVAYLLTLGGE